MTEIRVGITDETVALIITGKRKIRVWELKPQEAIRIATYLLDGVIEITTGEDRGFNEEWTDERG